MQLTTLPVILFASLNIASGLCDMNKIYEDIPDLNKLKILTPSLTSRKIAKLRLDNGVELYLVSDPQADASAAAVSVSVGSWNDPKEYPGMAHFCEHMLFMGTKTYPNEAEFQQFVNDHSGRTNAYTATDRTVYMFSVDNDSFLEGYKRFAHFFIDPLFNISGVERELHAIDQEHAKNIENDYRRQNMIFKETGNPNHPNHQFDCGNAKTLGHIPREALVNWYQNNYRSSRLHVVIYSNQPLDTLKQESIDLFSKIPKKTNTNSNIDYSQLTSEQQKASITYIKPLKDIKTLTLQWELPQNIGLDKDCKPAQLVGYVLRQSQDNGLLEQLKKEQLVESLYADVNEVGIDHHMFYIYITLTKQGAQNIDKVIGKCFEAIGSLKQTGVPRYLFQEMNKMAEIDYAYQGRQSAFEYASNIAEGLIDEPLATFPEKSLIASQYSAKKVQSVITYLTPDRCLYTVMAPFELTDIKPEKKEQWLGGEYTIKKIAPYYTKQWSDPTSSSLIGLPTANPFIPQNLTLIHETSSASTTPTLLIEDALGKSYYVPDTFYQVPEAALILGYKSPAINGDPRSVVLGDLYVKALSQAFAPSFNLAKVAGIHPRISFKNLKMMVVVEGYSEKASDFLNQMLHFMKDFTITEEQFASYKESIFSNYDNQKKSPPYLQVQELANTILIKDYPTDVAKIQALQTIQLEDLMRYKEELFAKGYLEALYGGNLTEKMAVNIDSVVKKILGFSPYPLAEQQVPQLLILSSQDGPYMVTEDFNVLGQAALLAIEEGPFTFERKAAQVILKNALSNDYFDTLRTKQQTGYIVQSFAKDFQMQLLHYFLIQSNTHEGEDLIARTEVFLENYLKDFSESLPESRFEEMKTSTIKSLKEPMTNFSEWVFQLYSFAFDYQDNFRFKEDLIAAIEKLSYSDLKQLTMEFLSRKNSRRLAVIVEGKLPEANQFKYQKVTSSILKESGSYISARSLESKEN